MLHRWITTIVVLMLTSAVFTKLPEDGMSTQELIKYWGYPVETHSAVTDDGYILELHRIPHGKSTTSNTTSGNNARPVVFLQHGFLGTSASWVLNPPNISLGFMLADAGYDVWMGNNRGNTYSKKHVSYPVGCWKFWNFCFDEMSKYDMKAMLTKALSIARQDRLYYIGYSEGSLMAFAGLSENLYLQEKIRINFAFAPITRLANIKTPLKNVAPPAYFLIKKMRDWIGFLEFLPESNTRSYFERILCTNIPKACELGMSAMCGNHNKHLNKTRLPVYFSHLPAGTSTKNMLHFMQFVKAKVFQKYDYERDPYVQGNMEKYGTKDPPQYNITKVMVPTVLVSGMQDWLSAPKDVEWTAAQLPRVIKRIQLADYNHIDFVWGLSAYKDVYEPVMKMIHADLNGHL